MEKHLKTENNLLFQQQILDTIDEERHYLLHKTRTRSEPNIKQGKLLESSHEKSRFTVLCRTALHLYQTEGTVSFLKRLCKFLMGERRSKTTSTESYKRWIQENEPDQLILNTQKQVELNFKYRPLISVLTFAHNIDAKNLERLISSVAAQTYSNWEFCIIANFPNESGICTTLEEYMRQDSRVKVKFLNDKLDVSGCYNELISLSRGEYIALLDQNDQLAPNALYEKVSLINQRPDADLIYSDEDTLDSQGFRCKPYFKPDWSPDFFYSSMYTGHLGVYRKSLISKIGGFRPELDGAQDYDLVLRLIEITDKIYHIPKILYHRQSEGSDILNLEIKESVKASQIKAVSEHFQRLNNEVQVMPGLVENLIRVKHALRTYPKVSIIIPTRDQLGFLQDCLDSVRNCNSYRNYEIIIVDNNSSEPETLEYLREISKEPGIRVFGYYEPFNFAAINNFAAKEASGELLLFLNNDTVAVSSEWLEALVEHAVRPEVGVVGARLLYPNNTVQHAGVIVGIGGIAGHSHKFYPADHPGYFNRAKAIQNVSAVTGACLMVRKEVFQSLGGFDEKNLAVSYNDVDFCLRIRQKKLRVIYTPYAELYHYESVSRGSDRTPKNARRLQCEAEYMLKSWKNTLKNDPYYNPNLTLKSEDFSISIDRNSA